MKKITLLINDALFNSLGLQNGASEEAVGLAISNMSEKAQKADQLQIKVDNMTQKMSDLQAKIDAAEAVEFDKVLNEAADDNLITNELKAVYAKQYKGDLAGLKEVLNATKPYEPTGKKLKEGEGAPKNKAALIEEFDKLDMQEGALENMIANNFEHYSAMYEAKFNKKPNQPA
ncbi:MAG: hypothetical protein ACK4EY_15165 [Flavipsychrobacter sp.]